MMFNPIARHTSVLHAQLTFSPAEPPEPSMSIGPPAAGRGWGYPFAKHTDYHQDSRYLLERNCTTRIRYGKSLYSFSSAHKHRRHFMDIYGVLASSVI